ncbi:NACHT, LRR and PYD domains-containing protein 3 [Desmophyllum pertusum]|uniref:NACHT, LRR and PYD domains-containing protein 3 n=1 Tax=Desmophyllum pertusum TaxID=174260 RepID=A0A9W9ZQ76_9CNID|nr:NACHT, LRR and PYD domains-containing protein 3 [Desmophyllum pertusum]
MGHAVDQNLLSLVQQDVKKLVENFKKTVAEQSAIQESLDQQRTEQIEMQNTVASLQDQQSSTRVHLEEHDKQLEAVMELMKENKGILETLVSVEKTLSEELMNRVQDVEKGLAETGDKVEQLEQGSAKTDDKMEQLEQGFVKTDDKVEQLEQGFAKTDDKVEQLEHGFAKTDDKVEQLEKDVSETGGKMEQLEQGFAKTDNKVEQLEQGFAKTDDKVEQLEQGFAKTDDKVEQLEKDVFETGGKVKQLEQGSAKTDDKMEQLEQGFAKTDDKMEQLEQGFAKTDDKVEQLEQGFAKTDDKVEQLEQGSAKTDDKMEQLERGFAKTDDKMEQLEQGFAKTDDKVEQLEQGFAKTDDKVEQLEKDVSETGGKVKQLEQEVRSQRMKENKPEASPTETFDVKTCRSKLAEHYKRTAKVPTSVWSKASPVNIHQIYTRLSWVKEEQTPAGSSQSELTHYTDVFTPNKNGDVPNRILVQGQTGIGKSTFVKKLAVDWAELDDEKTEDKQGDALERFENDADTSEGNKETSQDYEHTASEDEDTSSDEYNTSSDEHEENQKNSLKKFELVVVINLKEVSKCQSLSDVISRCNIFPEEEKALTEGLLSYIAKTKRTFCWCLMATTSIAAESTLKSTRYSVERN